MHFSLYGPQQNKILVVSKKESTETTNYNKLIHLCVEQYYNYIIRLANDE